MAISGSFAAGDEVKFADAYVEVDDGASGSYVLISTWATEVTATIGATPTAKTYPFQGNVVVTVGNKDSDKVKVACIYTEGSTAPFDNIYASYIASPGKAFNVRWTPAGSTNGNNQFTTSGGKLIMCTIPPATGDGVSPAIFEFEVECSSIGLGVKA